VTNIRDYLHLNEIDKLLATAKASPRYGQRNSLLVLLALRHALRISEVSISASPTSTSPLGESTAAG